MAAPPAPRAVMHGVAWRLCLFALLIARSATAPMDPQPALSATAPMDPQPPASGQRSTCPVTPLQHTRTPSDFKFRIRDEKGWRPSSLNVQQRGGSFGGAAGLYLSLLKTVLTGGHNESYPEPLRSVNGKRVNKGCGAWLPSCLLTWDGWARATALEGVVETIVSEKVPGDFAEVGVFRGGLSMYMQALLLVAGETESRDLWMVDSYQGMGSAEQIKQLASAVGHQPDPKETKWDGKLTHGGTAASKEPGRLVLDTFMRLNLLRPNVKVLPGWVQDVLVEGCEQMSRLALLRIDVDLYAPTYIVLERLYPRLVPGGFVLFDDYKLPYAAKAMNDYRARHGIKEPVRFLSGTFDKMAYWRKPAS